MTKCLAPAAALLVLLGCKNNVVTSGSSAQSSSIVGQSSATTIGSETVLIDIQGKESRPFSNESVHAVALVFILSDCPIANSYLPKLNRLFDTYHARGVPFFLVHADARTSLSQARRHADEYEIRPPVLLDPQHDWVRRAGATKTPEVAVFGSQGQVLYRGRIDDQYVGLGKRRAEVTSHDLADALDAILAGRPVKQSATEPIGCDIPALSNGD